MYYNLTGILESRHMFTSYIYQIWECDEDTAGSGQGAKMGGGF